MHITKVRGKSKYNVINCTFDTMDKILTIDFLPQRKSTRLLGAYPVDIGFDEEGEINNITVLWPPSVWESKELDYFPETRDYVKLVFSDIPQEDEVYESEVYVNYQGSRICIELKLTTEEKSDQESQVKEIHFVNQQFAVELNQDQRIIRLWLDKITF